MDTLSHRPSSADTPGSPNLPGIKSPAIDSLVEKVLAAKDSETHRTVLLALDRVLRASYYTVPNWTSPVHRMAFWDMFAWPETKPDYAFPYETTWWVDAEKAVKIGKAD